MNDKCIFCNLDNSRILKHTELFNVTYDVYPVTKLHTLFIPIRHVESFFDLSKPEKEELLELAQEFQELLRAEDASITGFNIGVNCGEDAGQTIPHCHIHLIPRRKGDMEDPKGGVRGVIPDKQKY